MWKLRGSLEIVDLRVGYFITRFSTEEDLWNILKEGPYFVVRHYLTIRGWNLDFMIFKATL